MRHLIAIDGQGMVPGSRKMLLAQSGGLGVELVRGADAKAESTVDFDRYLFVLEGDVLVGGPGQRQVADAEALVVVPGGAALTAAASSATLWLEFAVEAAASARSDVRVMRADPEQFEGEGFAHQELAGRSTGSQSLRVNSLRVEAGAGSPDFHIHAFDQFYIILEGEMQLDIGRTRLAAGPMTLVHLPAGLVHRNFNAGPAAERHISLLVPEPVEGEIFDYAVEIFDREAEFFDAASATTPTHS